MKKKIITISLAAMMGVGTVTATMPTNVFADKIDDLKGQSEELKKEQSEVDSHINKSQEEIERLVGEQEDAKVAVERLTKEISEAETGIEEKNKEIETKKAEIKKLEQEIEDLKERIKQRNELLKDRARSMQESGGTVNYIDVLLGAQSFSDFIGRVGAVATIVEADQEILRQQEEDKKELEQKQTKVKKDLASLEDMRKELEQMKANLDKQKKEKNNLIMILKEEEDHHHAEKLSSEEEKQLLASQEKAIEQAIKQEEERQAEAARKAEEARQAELARQAEAKKAAEAAKSSAKQESSGSSSNAGNSGGSDSSSGSSGGQEQVQTPPPSSGNWIRPSAGVLTSGLGQRWGSYHAGIDLAAAGTVPIYAAADGVVIQSYYSSSYGEVIFIAHSINGQTYTTVYAHMRSGSRSVSSGQTLSQGQQIGLMGNTGQSTGQHLHFELHRGGWNQAKSNAINPVGIIPL